MLVQRYIDGIACAESSSLFGLRCVNVGDRDNVVRSFMSILKFNVSLYKKTSRCSRQSSTLTEIRSTEVTLSFSFTVIFK